MDPNSVSYYHLLDLQDIATQMHGARFGEWILTRLQPNEALFRIAQETSIVLLPGRGFGGTHASGRVSLANLNEYDYANIGKSIRGMASEFFARFGQEAGASKATRSKPSKKGKK